MMSDTVNMNNNNSGTLLPDDIEIRISTYNAPVGVSALEDNQQTEENVSSRSSNNEDVTPSRSRRQDSINGRTHRNTNGSISRKLANGCCTFGVLSIASGAGLILIYLLIEYTNVFGEITNLNVISVPGFTLLFLGIAGSVLGIFFCWIYPRSRWSNTFRNHTTDRDISDAGFELPSSSSGYCNPSLIMDAPPPYSAIASNSGANNSRHLVPQANHVVTLHRLKVERRSTKPPSYRDAINKNGDDSDKNSMNEDPTHTPLPTPPPYHGRRHRSTSVQTNNEITDV